MKNPFQELIEQIIGDFGAIHEDNCDLNTEDGAFDGCDCAVNTVADDIIRATVEHLSHDIFDNEEQRKDGVNMYLDYLLPSKGGE